MNWRSRSPADFATAVWITCVRCGHWWLVPRDRARHAGHYVGPCCRHRRASDRRSERDPNGERRDHPPE